MNRFYQENDPMLKAELESWLDTPYRHFSGIKKMGTDCIHLVVKVIVATQANQGKQIIIPRYVKDWNLHRGEELLKTQIEKQLFVEKIAQLKDKKLIFSENVGDGDLVLFKYGRLSGHCGMYFQTMVYQTLTDIGVKKINFGDIGFNKRITDVYKIYRRI